MPYAMGKRYATGVVSVDIDLRQGENQIVFDNPWSQEEDVRLSYVKMASALNRSGREVMLTKCTREGFFDHGPLPSVSYRFGQGAGHVWAI